MALMNAMPKVSLKVFSDGKLKLVDEDLLKGMEAVLLVEDEHGFLVVYGIDRTETQRTITIGYEHGIGGDAGRALVAVGESLYIR